MLSCDYQGSMQFSISPTLEDLYRYTIDRNASGNIFGSKMNGNATIFGEAIHHTTLGVDNRTGFPSHANNNLQSINGCQFDVGSNK